MLSFENQKLKLLYHIKDDDSNIITMTNYKKKNE